jgi:hypothetical protein
MSLSAVYLQHRLQAEVREGRSARRSDAGLPEFSPALSEVTRSELCWQVLLSLTLRQRKNLAWYRKHAFNVSALRDVSQHGGARHHRAGPVLSRGGRQPAGRRRQVGGN